MVRKAPSPRLETILMVEAALQQSKQPLSIADLKRKLPKQVNHNTLKVILSYLEKSKKIMVSLQGIAWRDDAY